MPANNNRQMASKSAASPTPKPPTSKYTNKDGTKTITVPKSSASTPPAQPSPTTTSSSKGGASTNANANGPTGLQTPAPTINRKKQKRRAKMAAKAAAVAEAAAENSPNGLPSPASTSSAPLAQHAPSSRTHPTHMNHPQHTGDAPDWDDETESDVEDHMHYTHQPEHPQTNGDSQSKKSKKKKKQKGAATNHLASEFEHHTSGMSKDMIWNTSNKTERERIRQFWLDLGEEERRSLVKVEKDAVLKKMKEQQKHTCSCTVCGRKRTAIEEELEGLYDAYYEELESFANQPQGHPQGPPMLGNPHRLGPMTGLHPPRSLPSNYSNHHPSHGRIVEHVDNDEDEDDEDGDEYSEDELDDDDLEEPEEQDPRDSFFGFGSGLQVKGGILTVADDLLKNDGKKFIEMMEQLAERRMAREEDAKQHYPSTYNHPVNGGSAPNSHNHAPPDDDEYDDEEDEDEYDSQEDEYDEEEEDALTEEQRMEEGRRMFQIFAARMFEQRVLTAYREKVAKDRQQTLLQELEEESRMESQRKAKKAKEAQKRKDKAAQKKQALAEEKARRDAEKAAEEAQRSAEEKRRAEEAKVKAEEKRKKKELQKKAEEEERLRKEAERQRRVHEQKERQAEQERKAREAKEREKKLKEEQRVKEKEAREQKEKETRERREKHEKDKRDKEQRAAQAKAERDAKEKQKQEEKAAQKAAALVAPIPAQAVKKTPHLVSIPAVPQLPPTNHASPQISVATPALPKAPTPMKPRAVSHEVARSVSQASHSGSGASQNASPYPLTPVHTSPGPIGPPHKTSSVGMASGGPPTVSTSPLHAGMKSPPGLSQPAFPMGIPPPSMTYPPGMPLGSGFNPQFNSIFPPASAGSFRPPTGMTMPPGLGGPVPMGRGFPIPQPPPGFQTSGESMHGMNQGFGHADNFPTAQSPHSRQASASFDSGSIDVKSSGTPVLPVARPQPIGRPSSVVHGQRQNFRANLDVSNHLGSSVLLDDSDDPLGDIYPPRQSTAAPGIRPPRPSYIGTPTFMDPIFGSPQNHWGQSTVFSPPPPPPPPPGFGSSGWPTPAPPFPPPGIRSMHVQPHSVAVRLILCRACKELANNAADAMGFIDLSAIKGHVDSLMKEPVSETELLDMCETEGNHQNGGGTFEIRRDDVTGRVSILYDAASGTPPPSRHVGAPGEIGSPIVGAGSVGSSFGARG